MKRLLLRIREINKIFEWLSESLGAFLNWEVIKVMNNIEHIVNVLQLALVEQEQQTKTRGFEVQLQTTEDARRTSVAELRKLLTAQQRMSARYLTVLLNSQNNFLKIIFLKQRMMSAQSLQIIQ